MKVVNSRGRRIYGKILDERGTFVRVQESSQVADRRSPRWLWLLIEETDERRRDREDWERRMGERMHPAPHLSVAQAKELRRALDAFIKDSE